MQYIGSCELANEYNLLLKYLSYEGNGLPNMSQQINVRLKTIHGEVKYLKHITMEARKLQRLSLEPLKMLEDHIIHQNCKKLYYYYQIILFKQKNLLVKWSVWRFNKFKKKRKGAKKCGK